MIFKAASEHEAKELVESDPAVIKGVIQASLLPYKVAVLSKAYMTAAQE